MRDETDRAGIGTVIAMCVVLVLPTAWVLFAARAQPVAADWVLPGYTCSLSLFAVPAAVMACWFFRHSDRSRRRAFWISLALLVPIGIVLDLVFGPLFFAWRNPHAVIGWMVPAVGGRVPVEEIVFFVSGFGFLLLMYIWSSEYWLAAYQPSPVTSPSSNPRLFRVAMMLLTFALLVGAVLYKKLLSAAPDGFPGYLAYVTIVAILPPVYCFPWVMASINWRAFSLTQLAMVLICLLWEVTLAAPLQWWEFRPEMMTGIYIAAWSNLPIEEPFVWLASPFTVIITYETVRLYQRLPHRAASLVHHPSGAPSPVSGSPVSGRARVHE